MSRNTYHSKKRMEQTHETKNIRVKGCKLFSLKYFGYTAVFETFSLYLVTRAFRKSTHFCLNQTKIGTAEKPSRVENTRAFVTIFSNLTFAEKEAIFYASFNSSTIFMTNIHDLCPISVHTKMDSKWSYSFKKIAFLRKTFTRYLRPPNTSMISFW